MTISSVSGLGFHARGAAVHTRNASGLMDFRFLLDTLLTLLPGVPLTLELAVSSLALGGLLALPLALMRMSSVAPLDWLARSYVFAFRSTPLLVQIFLIYYGLGQFREVRASLLWPILREPYWCAVIALTLNTAAYSSEIIRGGILAVPFGQVEAARAVRDERPDGVAPHHRPAGLPPGAAGLRQRADPDDQGDLACVDHHHHGSHRDRSQADLGNLPRGRGLHRGGRDLSRHQFRHDATGPLRRAPIDAAPSPEPCPPCCWREGLSGAKQRARKLAHGECAACRENRRAPKELRSARGAEGHIARRARRRRHLDPGLVGIRQNRRCCAASTCSRPRLPARCRSMARRYDWSRRATGCGRPRPGQVDAIRIAHRHGVPELQPLVAHDGARERDRGAGPRAAAPARRMRRRRRGIARRRSASPKRETHYPAHLSGGQQQRAAIARALASGRR